MKSVSNQIISTIHKLQTNQNEYNKNYNQFKKETLSIINDENNKINIKNDENNHKIQNEIKRIETTFDHFEETLQRNEKVLEIHIELIEMMKQYQQELEIMKENVEKENEQLININNELLETMKELEEKKMRREMKKEENVSQKKQLKENTLKMIHKNVNQFKRKTLTEIKLDEDNDERRIEWNELFTIEEVKQLEEWTEMEIDSIIYKSSSEKNDINGIGEENSSFYEIVLQKENILILIETKENDKFGVFIKEKIENIGKDILDDRVFIFSVSKQDNQMKKYDNRERYYSFHLSYPMDKELFEVGKGDICVMKGSSIDKSFCKQQSFEYDGNDDALLGEGRTTFTPKRIVVIQMDQSKDQKRQMKKQLKEQSEKESLNLKELTQKIRSVKDTTESKYKLYETFVTMKIKELLFDSKLCSWKQHESTLSQRIFNIKRLLIIIKTEEGELFGAYVGKGNHFIFKYHNGEMKKQQLKQEDDDLKIQNAMKERLLEIGNNELILMKEHRKNECSITIEDETILFTPKHIQCFEMIETKSSKEEKLRKQQIEQEEKRKKMQEVFESIQQSKPSYFKQLEDISQLEMKEIFFDSEFCDWSLKTSTFHKALMNRKQFIILIETTTGKKFGCFINSTITSIGNHTRDKCSFAFSITRKWFTSYSIVSGRYAIKISNENEDTLMEIGNKDVVIMKKDSENKSTCKQYGETYEYRGEQYALLKGRNVFDIKRIQAFQMAQTKEWEEKRKQSMEIETAQLLKQTVTTTMSPSPWMKTIEDWSMTSFKEVVFNSDYCDWTQNTSTFSDRLNDKSHLVILIELDNDIMFGGYIEEKIKIGERISDPKMFLFTIKYDRSEKFDSKKNGIGFKLYDIRENGLFSFGREDIYLKKLDLCDESICIQDEKNFDYKGQTNILIGKTCFTPKRIQVFQMLVSKKELRRREKIQKQYQDEQQNTEKVQREKHLEEVKKLKRLIMSKKQRSANIVLEIEEMIFMEAEEVLFDSAISNWKKRTSTFDEKVFNKSNLLFWIEVDSHLQIGGFIFETISEINKDIMDKKAFLFAYSNEKSSFFKVKEPKYAIEIFDANSDVLFNFGKGDLIVMKEGKKDVSSSTQNAYKLKGNRTLLIGKDSKVFTPKRIQIIQFNQTERMLDKQETIEKHKVKEENIQMTTKLSKLKSNPTDEFKQIETITGMKINNLIFDNEFCEWDYMTSTFDKRLYGKSDIVIVIEDEMHYTFGFYLRHPIDKISQTNIRSPIFDRYSYLFTLNRNNNMKYPMIDNIRFFSFNIFKSDEEELFTIGENDVVIMKENNKMNCFCQQTAFDYAHQEKVLTGRDGWRNPFSVKRIQVWELEVNEEEKQKRQSLLSHEEKNIQKKLVDMTKTIVLEDQKEMKLIEEWSQTSFKELIFDTDCCDWRVDKSSFDKIIFGRKHLVFLMKDDRKNVFGAFINASIDKYQFYKNDEWKGEAIVDPHAFVFTMKSFGRMKEPVMFPIKKQERDGAFQLFEENTNVLFVVGNGYDICVMKENYKQTCTCQQQSFNYNNQGNVLIGKEGDNHPFTLKRLQVWQMEKTEEQQLSYTKKEEEKIALISTTHENEMVQLHANENKYLQQIQKEYRKEMKQIEQWTNTIPHSVIFDSSICNTKIDTSTFNQHIKEKQQLVFLIETKNGKRFGGFISEELINKSISDQRAMIFRFDIVNQRQKPIKLFVKERMETETVFNMYEPHHPFLFSFGLSYQPDIIVKKEPMIVICQHHINTSVFDYSVAKNSFISTTESDMEVEIQRILVFQMKPNSGTLFFSTESDAFSTQTVTSDWTLDEEENSIDNDPENKLNNQIEDMVTMVSLPNELLIIEQWTKRSFYKLIFDSNVDSWSQGKSVFELQTIGKENVVFFIQTMDGITLGGYIQKPITGIMKFLYDSNSFLFSNKSGKMKKYKMKSDIEMETIYLANGNDPILFAFGNDLIVYKEDLNGQSFCSQHNTVYDYGDDENALVPQPGEFTIRQLFVYQLE